MKYIFLVIIIVISYFIISINIKLHTENFTRAEQKEDIILQLNFLESELKYNDLGSRMQKIYPEGYVFVNALYGLAWCELSQADSEDSTLKIRALNEALYAFNNLESDKAKRKFHIDLNPEYGIFYNGWKNYLLSRILRVDTVFENSEHYIKAYKSQCEIISEALRISESPYLESYNQLCWPADMCVAMASLSNFDKIFGQKYKSQIIVWLHDINERLDPGIKMIPHQVNYESGKAVQKVRGSSSVLSLRMLAEINPEYARNIYNKFDSLFVDNILGLPVVLEYPKGSDGSGDIDSGPVVFGVGFSATIAMIGTYAIFENHELADQQYKSIHALGFSTESNIQKEYLFGTFPMADAFIAWGRATDLNYSRDPFNYNNPFRAIQFHLISLFIIIILWLLYFRKAILRRIKNAKNKHLKK